MPDVIAQLPYLTDEQLRGLAQQQGAPMDFINAEVQRRAKLRTAADGATGDLTPVNAGLGGYNAY